MMREAGDRKVLSPLPPPTGMLLAPGAHSPVPTGQETTRRWHRPVVCSVEVGGLSCCPRVQTAARQLQLHASERRGCVPRPALRPRDPSTAPRVSSHLAMSRQSGSPGGRFNALTDC